MVGSWLRRRAAAGSIWAMNATTRITSALLGVLLAGPAPAQEPDPDAVLKGLKECFAKTARPDGSFQSGIRADYPGMSDSAYSDLAPTVYAVILHRTFGWKLPHEDKTKEFLLARQADDGAFFNVK